MVGDFDIACEQADVFFDEMGLSVGDGQIAVDLGCGHGVHSIPLARRGYRVTSVDNSTHLIAELKSRSVGLSIRSVNGDLTRFACYLDGQHAALIVCMGDTVTHLGSEADVENLIRDASTALTPNGLLCFSLRDYASKELVGVERFISVRSDESRIHTCFLEYQASTVHVHDILQHKTSSGWQSAVSSHPKLRLPPEFLITTATKNGFTPIHQSVHRGMIHFVFCLAGSRNVT